MIPLSKNQFRIRLAAQVSLCVAAALLVFTNGQKFLAEKTVPEVQPAATFALAPDSLEAQAAVIYDPETGRVLYDKNAQMQLPLASLTKLMTADTALAQLSVNSSVRITDDSTKTINDSGDINLKSGQVWKAGDLIRYALLSSSNNAMAAVAESVGSTTFIHDMNANAKKLGLAQSYFLDPAGLDLTPGLSGAYGSARDMAILASAFYERYPSFFESTLLAGKTFDSGDGLLHGKATAAPLLAIPGLIGAKTGYTDLAGGNLVAIFDVGLGHPLVAVVLHSSEQGRYDDIRTLITAARAADLNHSTPL
jgi:serine-type D-Ala-D-Ala carboxypeptidase (penicillin-binding protein 5/6)